MRTYSEREVSAIIERAVERQRAADDGTSEAGLTLDEIERIGRDAGIDPAHLRAAAAEVDTAGRTLGRQTSHTRTQVVAERWIEGPLSLEGWEDAVAHLRASFGAPIGAAFGSTAGDTVQQVGQSYEWAHTSGLGIRTRVTVSPRGDRTRLHMTQLVGLSSSTVEGVAYGGIVALLVGLMGGGGAALAGLAAPWTLLVMVLTFVVAWAAAAPGVAALDRRWRAKKLRQLDALADDLTPILRAPSEVAPEATSERASVPAEPLRPPPAPRLDLDALAEPHEAPDVQAPRHQTRA